MEADSIKERWLSIQKRSYTNWINEVLKPTGDCVNDLIDDMGNGVLLCKLAMLLTSKRLRYQKNPKLLFQKQDNIQKALVLLEDSGCRIVNIRAPDILQKNTKLILGLMWSIVQYFHVFKLQNSIREQDNSKNTMMLNRPLVSSNLMGNRDMETDELVDKSKIKILSKASAINKKIIDDINRRLEVRGMSVRNLKTDWSDGEALCALVDYNVHGLYDLYRDSDPLMKVAESMIAAYKFLGIPQLIEPADFISDLIDEPTMSMYLACFVQEGIESVRVDLFSISSEEEEKEKTKKASSESDDILNGTRPSIQDILSSSNNNYKDEGIVDDLPPPAPAPPSPTPHSPSPEVPVPSPDAGIGESISEPYPPPTPIESELTLSQDPLKEPTSVDIDSDNDNIATVEVESPKLVMSAPPPTSSLKSESPDRNITMVTDGDRNKVREMIGADILSDMKGFFETQRENEIAEVTSSENSDIKAEDLGSSFEKLEMSEMEACIEYSESLTSESDCEIMIEAETREQVMSSISIAKIAKLEAELQQKNERRDSLERKKEQELKDNITSQTKNDNQKNLEIEETSFASSEVQTLDESISPNDDKDISQIVLPKLETSSSDEEKIIEPISDLDIDFSMILNESTNVNTTDDTYTETTKAEHEFETQEFKSEAEQDILLQDMPPTPPHSTSSRSSLSDEKKHISVVESLASLQGSGSVCAGGDDIVEDVVTPGKDDLKQFEAFEEVHTAHYSIHLAELMNDIDDADHAYEAAKSTFRTYITQRHKYYKGNDDEILSFYKCCFYLRKALLRSYYRIFFSGRFVKFDDLPLPKEGKTKGQLDQAIKKDPILAKLPNTIKNVPQYSIVIPDRSTLLSHKKINNEAINLFTDIVRKYLAASRSLEALVKENSVSEFPVSTESFVEILEKMEDEVSVSNLILAGHCNPE